MMKSKENRLLEKHIEDTFKVLDSIEEVKIDHFFKSKVLQKIETKNEIKSSVFNWLTPQLQLATLSLILLMNLSAVFYAYSTEGQNLEASLETFAEDYSLKSESISLIN